MAPIPQHKNSRRPKKQKQKLTLVFDENARRDFLVGFRKRKQQRKEKAKEQLEAQVKEERKRIRLEAKEAYKRIIAADKPIPELEELWSQEVDMDTHHVSVKELSAANLSRQNNFIGINQVQYEENKKPFKEKKPTDNNEIDGMEISEKRKEKVKGNKEKNKVENLQSKKDVKNYIRKQATQMVKQSKIFQKKKKVQKQKDLKLKRREERKVEKINRIKTKQGRMKRK